MAASKNLRIGVIIGSTRVVRVGPQIADFVLDTLKAYEPSLSTISFDRIDLLEHGLPLFDEPVIPVQVQSPEDYTHEHTRIWGRRIAACDGFVFVASQRNWSIPAELKNAIDYLFNEWKGKPAMIVAYGGHGGDKCSAELAKVLTSIGVRMAPHIINMSFPGLDFRGKCFKGQPLGLDAANDPGPWSEHRKEIASAFWEDMVTKMLTHEADSTTALEKS